MAALGLALLAWLLLGLMGLCVLAGSTETEDPDIAVGVSVIGMGGMLLGGLAVGLGALIVGLRRPSRPYPVMTAVSGVLSGVGAICGWVVFLVVTLLPAMAGSGARITEVEFAGDPLALTEVANPSIADALRANVFIESNFGWRGTSTGSGVIVALRDGRALILTNRHVIDPHFRDGDSTRPTDPAHLADYRLQVRTLGQSLQDGRVLWLAPGGIDLALLETPCGAGSTCRPANWAKGRPLRIGARVFAIGNPQKLEWTYTEGCISQLRIRQLGDQRLRVIQTQTPITFGNSGGGLYDADGFLIGINTWTVDKRTSEGLSFAITLDALLDLNPPVTIRP